MLNDRLYSGLYNSFTFSNLFNLSVLEHNRKILSKNLNTLPVVSSIKI